MSKQRRSRAANPAPSGSASHRTEYGDSAQGDECDVEPASYDPFAVRPSVDADLMPMLKASAISVEVAAARGYVRVTERTLLTELGFSREAPLPGLLIPFHGVDGSAAGHQYRPDRPRTVDGKSRKYERPFGTTNVLDVPPTVRHLLNDVGVPLGITEGSKKADAAATAGLLCVSLAGVDNWVTGGAPLPDWDDVALEGRDVWIAYDSDAMTKESVRGSLERLTLFLTRQRVASVRWVVLPHSSDMDLATGEPIKGGLDDYFAAGHTADEVMALAESPHLEVNVSGQLYDATGRALAGLHMVNVPPFLFQRSDALVEVQPGGQSIEIEQGRLKLLTARHIEWVKSKKDGDDWVTAPANPNDAVVKAMLDSWDEWPYPVLDRVVTAPVFAADGTLRTEPGYNWSARSLYAPDATLHNPKRGVGIRTVPASPSPADVRRALAMVMDDMLGDFMLADDASRAHALAMVLQPFARDLIRGNTPMFNVNSPKQGSGKTLFVETALAPALGRVDSWAEPHGDEELEKRITTAMNRADPLFFVDNVTRQVNWSSLASALTKERWSGRVLGETRGISVPISCMWVMTANNPTFSPDLSRRVVGIRLDTGEENPHTRSGFRHTLPAWALDNRRDLVWASCVLIQAWLSAGRPAPSPGTPHLGKYGPWRRVMGGIVAHHGYRELLGNMDETDDASPEHDALRSICEEVVKEDGSGAGMPFTSSQLLEFLQHDDNADIRGAIDPSGGRAGPQQFASRVGRFLSDHVDQVVGGYRLVRDKKRPHRGGKAYRFVLNDGWKRDA